RCPEFNSVNSSGWSIAQAEYHHRKIDKAHARFLSSIPFDVQSAHTSGNLDRPLSEGLQTGRLGKRGPSSAPRTRGAASIERDPRLGGSWLSPGSPSRRLA